MMSPWLNRTLHLRLAPQMNLRVHSGHGKLGMASGAFTVPIRRFTIGKPTMNSLTDTGEVIQFRQYLDITEPKPGLYSSSVNPMVS
jgi:hypothetical protein